MFFFFQAEDGIRDYKVTGVQTCALPISSARMRAARSSEAWPLAVSDMRREVRWNRLVLSRVSSRVMALEMVGWETPRSAAALAKEPVSATLAKMAQASRSGSLGMKFLE